MDKQQKLKIALPLLVVVLAFVYGPLFFGSDSRKSDNNIGRVNNGVQANTGGFDVAMLSSVGNRKKARTTYAEWGQNPFMLKRAPKELYIEGIMWDKNNPKAIINGIIVGAGDVVEGKTIIEVKANSVIIRGDDGKEFELK